MPVYALDNTLSFPPVTEAEDGLLAIGGDLSSDRLLLAYRSGIFPWYSKNEPILWWSPDPRFVLFPNNLKVSKSMKSLCNQQAFEVTFNKNFEAVIQNCKQIFRPEQGGTWITDEMRKAYIDLHLLGYAKSVEVWKKNELVGGLYGVDLGGIFCGESMFSKHSNASKYGLIRFADAFKHKGGYLIDCQVYSEHLESLGAHEIPRTEFLNILKQHTGPPLP